MSMRSLIEINHDHLHELKSDPEQFVKSLDRTLTAGVGSFIGGSVISTRHHSGVFYVDLSTPGFPIGLTYSDHAMVRDKALVDARALVEAKSKSRNDLVDMVARLMTVIEQQKELLDAPV